MTLYCIRNRNTAGFREEFGDVFDNVTVPEAFDLAVSEDQLLELSRPQSLESFIQRIRDERQRTVDQGLLKESTSK